MGKKKITIKDVAKHSGVSIATVSLILNGNEEKFNPSTVQKVLAAKEELGYQPDYFARQMVTKKTKTIGVLVPDITNPFFNTLMRGIEDCLYQQQFVTILCNANFNHQKEIDYLSELAHRGVDGFIIATSAVSTKTIHENLKKQGKPFIVLDQKKASGYSDAVLTDDYHGGYLAGSHLLNLGHKEIALIYPENPPQNVQTRMDGFKAALDTQQISHDHIHFFPTHFSKQGGYMIVPALLESKSTAVFALNDELAFGVYRGLEENGKLIPQDYSIIGYDNIDMCEYMKPKLTTIAQPIFELGQACAKLLLQRIKTPDKQWEEQLLPVKLTERASTMPLR
ncbi:LacI family transcriptional regulator [Enterococcus sp. 10A9_DIV0425]|uniref:LacI family transcriptional regulator n=1 Tax=Candidatus Enterococcus wittei TaxID=1987383 RepID=A0A242K123_9ENTE|nr:LacI family DNA-binding transcriptional regulator [Enterococcus sp. 10A9_DIV0425]OTP11263.1 LacI family transcriptional regulator [Enterococcus sp. 10A9_DIV0425]THE15817.1 LacI family transcriptional regulator [Enterococcus hirae]